MLHTSVRSRKSWSGSFRESIRLFTPAWHAIVMGTGALTILFNVFPYHTTPSHLSGLQSTALAFLILNLLLFTLITTLTIARYILFPSLWRATLLHPTQSLFIGCAPMGFATILIGAVNVVYDYFGVGGRGFVLALWALWWVDIAASVLVCFGQLHIMFTRQSHSLPQMTMTWLLPIVTLIVGSAAGGVIAHFLVPINLSYVYLTLGTCFLLVTIGITLSLAVMTIYLLRLAVYKVPRGLAVFSVYLPLGPLGQAGYTYVVLGEVASQVFPAPSLLSTSTNAETTEDPNLNLDLNILANPLAAQGATLNSLAWVLGFALWSFATCWVVLALLVLVDLFKSGLMRSKNKNTNADSPPPPPVPFKVTFWGMIFPNGVYANLTIHLSSSINSQILRVWGTVYAIFTIALWVFAFLRTIFALKDGTVFEELLEVVQEQADVVAGAGSRDTGTDSESVLESVVQVEDGGSRIEMNECSRNVRTIETSV